MADDLSLSELLSSVRSKKPDLKAPSQHITQYNPVRRRWLAVMHLMGASFAQLGKATQKRPQTINKAVEKEISVEVRSKSRLSLSLSFEALSWYTDKFYEHSAELVKMTVQDAAKWLQTTFPYNSED